MNNSDKLSICTHTKSFPMFENFVIHPTTYTIFVSSWRTVLTWPGQTSHEYGLSLIGNCKKTNKAILSPNFRSITIGFFLWQIEPWTAYLEKIIFRKHLFPVKDNYVCFRKLHDEASLHKKKTWNTQVDNCFQGEVESILL